MYYLTHQEVLDLHMMLIARSGGSAGLRDANGLDSALAQPQMTFGGVDLYPSIAEKAAALGFSLVLNHPFIDGNKRIGQMAMEAFLMANGHELDADVDDQEQTILQLAAGNLSREKFVEWVRQHLVPGKTEFDENDLEP